MCFHSRLLPNSSSHLSMSIKGSKLFFLKLILLAILPTSINDSFTLPVLRLKTLEQSLTLLFISHLLVNLIADFEKI